MKPLPSALLLGVATALPLAAQTGWSTPVLETALNSTASDTGPHLSFDGGTLHFASFRSGNWEIWSATRTAPGMPWSTPVVETALNDPTAVDDQPFLAPSQAEILFATIRPTGTGSFDIMRATRPGPGLPWSAPTFVTEVNSPDADSAPSMTADGLELYFLTTGWGAPFAPQNAIFRASRASTALPFGAPAVVSELLTPNTHRDVEVSADGLGIVYTEYVAPRLRVFQAERTSRSLPFGPPVALAEFDAVGTSLGVYSLSRSPFGNEALLAAGFPAASGSQEIMSTRFDGLTHFGEAGIGSSMTLPWRDSLNPGKVYVLAAALGNTGFPLGGNTVPLDGDWLLAGTFGQNLPGFTAGWAGLLDVAGEAAGSLTNSLPLLNGFTFYVGAFTLDQAAPFGVARIGNSFAVQFQ